MVLEIRLANYFSSMYNNAASLPLPFAANIIIYNNNDKAVQGLMSNNHKNNNNNSTVTQQ